MIERRFLFSYPGVMEHAEQAAQSLHERGRLQAYFTTFAFKPRSALAAGVRALPNPVRRRLESELRRREIRGVPQSLVITQPLLEWLRVGLQRTGAGEIAVDRVWDWSSHAFDRAAARRHVPGSGGVVAFEYTALESFTAAKRRGLPCVLHVVSMENRAYTDLVRRQKVDFPELARSNDAYFERLFEARQARREAEIALADLVIVNSSLTKASHVAAGAPAEKIAVAHLGAPPPAAQPSRRSPDEAMVVIWSGTFSIRKGAHLMLEAWRTLNAGPAARLKVFGKVDLAGRLMQELPSNIELMGSVPRETMMAAYDEADVMAFPSLSDGFGQSVTEALSRGVPVIVSDQAGAADLVEPGQSGLRVPAGDVEALAGALQWCLDNRTILAEMRGLALAAAAARQWSDFRRDHLAAIDQGLRRAGFDMAVSQTDFVRP